jgi:hypothetical protein
MQAQWPIFVYSTVLKGGEDREGAIFTSWWSIGLGFPPGEVIVCLVS